MNNITTPDAATLVRLAYDKATREELRAFIMYNGGASESRAIARLLADAYEARDAEVRELRAALKFYGPLGDFDCGDYELKIAEDNYGDKARAALAATEKLRPTPTTETKP